MNKEKFLMELREYLSILENQEQEDILSEYAQHIDMKMQKGLSEEDAIRDFGPMQELAAGILGAYHVKPEFRRKDTIFKLPTAVKSKENKGESFLKRGLAWIRKKIAGAVYGIRNGFQWLGGKCRAAGQWFMKPFRGKRDGIAKESKENKNNMKEMKKEEGHIRRIFQSIGHGITVMWGWIVTFCIFWLKLMWNAGWLMFSLFFACMALIILMGVGAIPVFLVQGYPLIGIFMFCLGGLLCFSSLSCGAFSLLIRKKKESGNEESKESGEEVQYEQTA
ncbi:MAG: DUF1700 domain-containing protein [Lachnospiraceae bacterium]|nr:DUF1700 domain-containing protein [Lachnospiraceae bacterium]